MVVYGLSVLTGNAAGLLICLQLGKRWPKHLILAAALFELGCAALSFGLPNTLGETWFFCMRSMLFGFGQAIVLMMMQSMMADVIQWDRILGGGGREGALSSLVAVVQKSAPAFSALLVGFLLSAGGYLGGKPGMVQPPSASQAILLVVSILPGAILLVSAVPMALFYDLTEAKLSRARQSQARPADRGAISIPAVPKAESGHER